MKEIKLWQIETHCAGEPTANEIKSVKNTETENQLEEIITRVPHLLMEDLRLVGRQTDTPGGPLDLLGVDGDGRIVVFELKRGMLTRDAVAQVIDYASFLSELEPDELADHVVERSGRNGIEKIDNFLSWYQEQHGCNFTNREQPRMVLVGLGADDRTRRMVSFLAERDIEISLITFHGFLQNDTLLLSRQIEIQQKEISGEQKISKQKNLEILKLNVKKAGVEDYYYDMSSQFRDDLIAYEWPNQGGYSYSLQETTQSGAPTYRVYTALYVSNTKHHQVRIYYHPRAVEIAKNIFKSIQEEFSSITLNANDGGINVWVNSNDTWEKIKPRISELNLAIVDEWKKRREEKSKSELEELDHVSES